MFMRNLRDIIQTEGTNATGHAEVFFDEDSIHWGQEFDRVIYPAISNSYSFILILTPHYLHIENLWCAKEIYRAIQFENAIREHLSNQEWCFIFPLIYRGPVSALPNQINTKNAIFLNVYETEISNNIRTNEITRFQQQIHDTLFENYKLIAELENPDIEMIIENLEIPNDDTIRVWVQEQKMNAKVAESQTLPKLK
jgi:hypothetical protein